MVNTVSALSVKELPEEEEVKRKISEIKKGKVVVFTEEVLTSAVIAAAWTSFYGGGITEGIIAMIAGAFVAVLARYIKILAPNEMVLNFLLSFFVAAFAYISAKFGLTEDYGNPSSLHNKGVIAENYMNDARKKIAKTLKVQEKEICFTSGGTESNNLAIIGVAEANKRSGKHVITTSIEHPSVSATMAYLEEHGYEVTYLPVDAQGRVKMSALEAVLRPDTIMVSTMLVNNEVGAVMPVEEIAKMVHEKSPKALYHVDAIQGFGKYHIYPKRMGIDLLAVSAVLVAGHHQAADLALPL